MTTTARRHRECQPPPLPASVATRRRASSSPCSSSRSAAPSRPTRPAPARCRTARSTTRMSSSRSTADGHRHHRHATARRWARARAPACRWSSPTRWRPTGRGCKLVQAPGDEPRYGNQDTDGSRSVRHFIQPMRQCGAAMRQMLEQAAAKQWGVPVGEVAAATTRSSTRPRAASSATASSPRPPWTCRPRRRPAQAEGRRRLPLHGQGQRPDLRPARHHHRQGGLRPGHPPAGHEVRRGRTAAGGRRQGEVVRRRRP